MSAGRRPLVHVDGYLPLEDHGLIGDGHTAALVGRDGAITWLCAPRFDSPPVFCGLLDARRGGAFHLAPDRLLDARQYYETDTGVLVTELRGPDGIMQVTDACLLRPGTDLTQDLSADRGELQRSVRVLQGRVRVQLAVRPRDPADVTQRGRGIMVRLRDRDLRLQLWASRPLDGLETEWELGEGDLVHVRLGWKRSHYHYRTSTPEEDLDATRTAWRSWIRHVHYDGPRAELVRRSAITLKLLDYFENGALIAAPTSSLPERIGGERNWDYRYAWIRDAAFAVHAMRRIGLGYEASGFLGWVLDAAEREGRPRVLHRVDGTIPVGEHLDPELEGYRGSRPVRWGNAAVEQRQNDIFGEVLDCAFQWARHDGEIDPVLWASLCRFAEAARNEWREPDHGIWEVRSPNRIFTYSVAMSHVALDRAARLAEMCGLGGPVDTWRANARTIRDCILREGFSEARGALTESLGGEGLDASILALPLRRVVEPDHPKMRSTVDAITRGLSAGGGLLYRYDPDETPDGLEGHEGAFLLCSFWLVENLALQGRLDEAGQLFESLCDRASPLGLLPEQIEPSTGAFVGNFPQAMSHIGVIAAAERLVRVGRA